MARLHLVMARLHLVMARLHLVMARLHLVMARLHLVMARLHLVMARLHLVMARLHLVMARLHLVMARIRQGRVLSPQLNSLAHASQLGEFAAFDATKRLMQACAFVIVWRPTTRSTPCGCWPIPRTLSCTIASAL
ncbi:hypothetical protein ACQY0O_004077 [Thecaphora frezii]